MLSWTVANESGHPSWQVLLVSLSKPVFVQYSHFPTSLDFPKCGVLPPDTNLRGGCRSLLKATVLSIQSLTKSCTSQPLGKLMVFGVGSGGGVRLRPTPPLWRYPQGAPVLFESLSWKLSPMRNHGIICLRHMQISPIWGSNAALFKPRSPPGISLLLVDFDIPCSYGRARPLSICLLWAVLVCYLQPIYLFGVGDVILPWIADWSRTHRFLVRILYFFAAVTSNR